MALTSLKGIGAIGESQLTEQITINVIHWLNWGLLGLGGYFNVRHPQSGAFGGSQSQLYRVEDPNYTDGQVWQAFRSNWVWESGINLQFSGTQPIAISGVHVNGTFYPSSTSGAFSHYYDYTAGRVVFDSPIATGSTVNLSYSYKWIDVRSVDTPDFMHLIYQTMRADDPTLNYPASGNLVQLPNTRVQMPVIFVEAANNREMRGWQLGGGHIARNDIILHIFTEEPWVRNNLLDTLSNQTDTKLTFFNVNTATSGLLDYRNMIQSTTKSYPDLITLYPNGDMYILENRARALPTQGAVFKGMVTWSADLYLGNV